MLDWLISNIIPLLIGIIPSFFGSYLLLEWRARRENKPLNQILNFRGNKLIFVFPHRDPDPGGILPRTSTEDFLAVNNFISATIKVGKDLKMIAKDADHVKDSDKNENIVAICSPKSNRFTRQLQEDMIQAGYNNFYKFERVPNIDRVAGVGNQWRVSDGTGKYPSPTYAKMKELKDDGILEHEIPQYKFEDVATITKIRNPWNSFNYIFIIAGIRGIGTWGAAEGLKKKWEEIYNHPNLKDKSGEFSALLRITYRDFDIVTISVYDVKQPIRKPGPPENTW